VYVALIEYAAPLRSPAYGWLTRLAFVPAPVGSPAAVFFLGTSVPAFGDADG